MSSPTLQSFLNHDFSAGGPPLTRLLFQPMAALVAWWSCQRGLSPTLLTSIRLLLALIGAVFYSQTGTLMLLFAFLFCTVSYVFDCADGQLARAAQKTSEFGAWFDKYVDLIVTVSMGFAVAYYGLQTDQEIPIFLAAAWFTVGSSALFYTSDMKRQMESRGMEMTGFSESLPKKILGLCNDAPVVILLLCVARPFPSLLLLTLAVLGFLSLGVSVAMGVRNFAPPK